MIWKIQLSRRSAEAAAEEEIVVSADKEVAAEAALVVAAAEVNKNVNLRVLSTLKPLRAVAMSIISMDRKLGHVLIVMGVQ